MVTRIGYLRGRARLIQAAIVIVFIAVFLRVASGIPHIDDEVVDRFTILDLLRSGLPLVLLGVVLSSRAALEDVVYWHTASILGIRTPEQHRSREEALVRFCGRIFQLVAVTAAWVLCWSALSTVVDRYPDYDWALTVTVLGFVLLLLGTLLGAYQALQPLMEVGGEAGVTGASGQAATVRCATCDAPNLATQQFCGSCGTQMQQTEVRAAAVVADGRPCSNCGVTLRVNQPFCTSCGTRQVPVVE